MRSPRRYRRARLLWYRWMESRKERTHNDFDYTRRILKSNSKVKQFLPQFVQTMSDRWPLKEDWRISKKICRKYLKNPLQLHPAERLDDYLPQMEWRFCYYFDGFNSLSHDNRQYDLLALSLCRRREVKKNNISQPIRKIVNVCRCLLRTHSNFRSIIENSAAARGSRCCMRWSEKDECEDSTRPHTSSGRKQRTHIM